MENVECVNRFVRHLFGYCVRLNVLYSFERRIRHTSQPKSKLRVWMEEKLRNHIGFIAEAMIEGA